MARRKVRSVTRVCDNSKIKRWLQSISFRFRGSWRTPFVGLKVLHTESSHRLLAYLHESLVLGLQIPVASEFFLPTIQRHYKYKYSTREKGTQMYITGTGKKFWMLISLKNKKFAASGPAEMQKILDWIECTRCGKVDILFMDYLHSDTKPWQRKRNLESV